jgi:8-oxo-dGTP pyrophosphatase MutT (NUDIX family)
MPGSSREWDGTRAIHQTARPGRMAPILRGMPNTSSDEFYERLLQLESRSPFVFPADAIPKDFRQSAVLIPFWEQDGEIRTLLTRRSSKLRKHAGQIAFAGGMLDSGETFEEAALREASEEVGINSGSARILGRLDDAWSGARSHLVPFVAWLDEVPEFVPNPGEVEEILLPSLSDLMRPGAQSAEEVFVAGIRYQNAIVEWPGGRAYGLTADLLLEALEWGSGKRPERGRVRLDELRAYFAAERGQQP